MSVEVLLELKADLAEPEAEQKARWAEHWFTFEELKLSEYRIKKGEKSTRRTSNGTALFHLTQTWNTAQPTGKRWCAADGPWDNADYDMYDGF